MKLWKKILIGLGVLVLSFVAFVAYTISTTKKHSPLEVAKLSANELNIEVSYCRPYKKGRVLFGEAGSGALESYGEVWRTGANEATVLSAKTDFYFAGQIVKAGDYSLWTVPGASEWKVILNSEVGQWGVGFGGTANHNPESDVVSATVPSTPTNPEMEQFTISFTHTDTTQHMNLTWGAVGVSVPLMP